MACVTAKGRSIIRNAASEPHIQELCHLLNMMGAKILHIGSNTLKIDGVEKLHGVNLPSGLIILR
jgi:UDP-N-acetylglucosamine 1-carboxyvinyltransferase